MKPSALLLLTLLSVAVLIAISPTSATSHPDHLEQIDQQGGTSQAFAIQGDYAYMGTGNRLTIFNIANPIHPSPIGTISLPDTVQDIALSTAYAYVTTGKSGMQIINVSNPANPVRISSYQTSSHLYKLVVQTGYAYLGGFGGLWIVNIDNPTQPILIGQYPINNQVQALTLEGSLLYLTFAGASIRTLDVSNPAQPIQIGDYTNLGDAKELVVVGNYGYLAHGSMFLRILDLHDPTHLTEIAYRVTHGDARGVAVVGSTLYLVYGPSLMDGYAGLQLFDITDPTNPIEVGNYTTLDNAQQVQVIDTKAYLLHGNGLQIVEVTDPSQISLLGSFGTAGAVGDIALQNSYLYLVNGDDLQIWDVRQPHDLLAISSLDLTGQPTRLEVAGNYAYVADRGRLRIVDISNPASPIEVSSIYLTDQITELAVQGDYLYVSYIFEIMGQWGIRVIEIADPTNPTVVGSYDRYGDAASIQLDFILSGTYLYLTNSHEGLSIIEVQDGGQLVQVGQYDAYGLGDLVWAEGIIYLVSNNGFKMVDVLDPTHPVELGMYESVGYGQELAVVDSYAYWLASDPDVVEVIDLADRAHPVRLANHEISGWGYELLVEGELVYVATGNGLYLLRYPGKDRFTPDRHGFSFVPPTVQASWRVFQESFGRENVDGNLLGQLYFEAFYQPFIRDGLAAGMAAASGLLYKGAGWVEPADFLEEQGVGQAWELAADSPELVTLLTRYQGYQLGLAFLAAAAGEERGLEQVVADLKRVVDGYTEFPMVIWVYGSDAGKRLGHALIPYQYTQNGQIVELFVYDVNYPGSFAPKIVFDLAAESWHYDHQNRLGVWGTGQENAGILAIPLSLYTQPSIPAWQPWDNAAHNPAGVNGYYTVGVTEAAHLLLTDNQGQQLGYLKNGALVREIPQAFPFTPLVGLSSMPAHFPETYLLPMDSSFQVEVVYAGKQPATTTLISPGWGWQIDSRSSTAGAKDTITFAAEDNRLTVLAGSSANGRSLTLIHQEESWGVAAKVENVFLAADKQATLGIVGETANGILFSSQSHSQDYNVQLRYLAANGHKWFVATGLTIEAGDTHFLILDWNELGWAWLQLDQGSDGSIDGIYLLPNEVKKSFVPALWR